MAKFRKKPIIVDAVQLGEDLAHPAVKITAPERGSVEPRGIVRTKHGQVFVNPGDWLIAETDGSGYYPCRADIFAATYEPVSSDLDALHAEVCAGTGMRMKNYTCVRCGGHIVPGVNGFIEGLSRCSDGDPSGGIPETYRGVHYLRDCSKPTAPVEPLKLHPIADE